MVARDSDSEASTTGPVSRRTLIRLLVGSAIGIPIAVESRTLLGMLDQHFLGGERHEGTAAASPNEVSVGDELLPETDPVERVTRTVVNARDNEWRFVLEAEVENTAAVPYEFRLGAVETSNGPGTGGTTTGAIEPGETTPLVAEWSIPEGGKPSAVQATGILDPHGEPEEVSARVALGNVPVERLG